MSDIKTKIEKEGFEEVGEKGVKEVEEHLDDLVKNSDLLNNVSSI